MTKIQYVYWLLINFNLFEAWYEQFKWSKWPLWPLWNSVSLSVRSQYNEILTGHNGLRSRIKIINKNNNIISYDLSESNKTLSQINDVATFQRFFFLLSFFPPTTCGSELLYSWMLYYKYSFKYSKCNWKHFHVWKEQPFRLR